MANNSNKELPHFLSDFYPSVAGSENLFNLTLWELQKGAPQKPETLFELNQKWPVEDVQQDQLYSTGIEWKLPDTLSWHQEDYFLSTWEVQSSKHFEKTERKGVQWKENWKCVTDSGGPRHKVVAFPLAVYSKTILSPC